MNHYTFEDLYVGMKESFTVEIIEDMQRSFTNMSGDVNPMHLYKNECLTGGTRTALCTECVRHRSIRHLLGSIYLGRNVCFIGVRWNGLRRSILATH